MRKNGLLIL
ncbi:hypothetical protein D039_1913A, partial [Vibrio parahaemolyticus EKP-028]